MGKSLPEIRKALDEVDQRIVDALAARQRLVAEVLEAEPDRSTDRDEIREHEILARVERRARDAGIDPDYVASLFREIIQHSVESQRRGAGNGAGDAPVSAPLTVGYQGGAGAYSHLAAAQHFGERPLDCRGFRSFRELVEAVERGKLDYAMLPVENTTAGSINEAYDVLAHADVAAVGEEVFRVEHCLVALEPIPLAGVRRIASHPQALAQCSDFLSTLGECHIESYTDTAMAVGKVVRDADPTQAAIASREAARRHGLEVLKSGIANQEENYTRFLVIARAPEPCDPSTPGKTSLVLATLHQKAALATCLNVLADHDLNLTKLESRPRKDTPFEYLFYIDFEGNVAEPDTAAAVAALKAHTSYLKVLGSYPVGGSNT